MASTSKTTASTAATSANVAAGAYNKPAPPQAPAIGVGLKTDAAAEKEMRQAIHDLVASVDPYVRVDSEAEDILLTVASEFLESTTNFSARLARHRGSDSLDVKDFQLHLERHHGIRIPGFVSTDDIGKVPAFAGQRAPTSSQQLAASVVSGQTGAVSAGTTAAGAGASGGGKGKEKASMAAPTLRSRRLAAVKQATK